MSRKTTLDLHPALYKKSGVIKHNLTAIKINMKVVGVYLILK